VQGILIEFAFKIYIIISLYLPTVISAALGPNVAVSSPVMIVFLNMNAVTPAATTVAASSPKIVGRIMTV
jgi:hypothetical protein